MTETARPPPPPPSPRRIRRVLSFAKPHLGLFALSMLVMAFHAFASNARLLLLYPIVTRVFSVSDSSRIEQGPRPAVPGASAERPEDLEDLDTVVRQVQKKGGRLAGFL